MLTDINKNIEDVDQMSIWITDLFGKNEEFKCISSQTLVSDLVNYVHSFANSNVKIRCIGNRKKLTVNNSELLINFGLKNNDKVLLLYYY